MAASDDKLMLSPTPSEDRNRIAVARAEKVSKAVARLIAKEVAERGMEPGASLPPEQVMAERYGVGRSSIREALRLLETQGLIVIRPGLGGGPVVGRPSPVDFGKTMTLFLQFQGTRYSHVLDALAPVEGMCAAMAAAHCAKHPEIFNEYIHADLLEAPSSRLGDEAWVNMSARFHGGLWEIAGNDVLKLIGGAIGFVFADRVKFDEHREWTTKERRRVHAEHLEIANAVRDGDITRARELNEAHYIAIGNSVRRRYPNLAGELIDWH
jgi:GntR family transcriptional repressor for pyruvate dehydrogenase complex